MLCVVNSAVYRELELIIILLSYSESLVTQGNWLS